jgi:hypothetical protein
MGVVLALKEKGSNPWMAGTSPAITIERVLNGWPTRQAFNPKSLATEFTILTIVMAGLVPAIHGVFVSFPERRTSPLPRRPALAKRRP